MTSRSMLDAALHLGVELHQPIIPLAPRAKNPIVRRGLRSATSDEATIRRWWARTPDANIGLLCGLGLLVLDIDGLDGKRSFRALECTHGRLPETVESKTARGRHLLFTLPDDMKVRPSVGLLGPGLDVRGDGSYIVAPPSIHPSGHRYRWRRGRAPGQYPLGDAPGWLVDLVRAPPPHAVSGERTRKQHVNGPPRHDSSASGRDFALALEMLRDGASDDRIEATLRRTSKKLASRGDAYLTWTIQRARDVHESSAPLVKMREARLEPLPARLCRPGLTRVHLVLAAEDGELVNATIVVPSAGYDGRAIWTTWQAALPDVDPRPLVSREFSEVRAAWSRIKWRGRRWRVAVRDGQVRWIRQEVGAA